MRKGQVVAELDKQELSLPSNGARLRMAQALARLGLDPDQENVRPEITPSIRQAKAQMEDAKSKFDNASRLVKTGDISQERFTEIAEGLSGAGRLRSKRLVTNRARCSASVQALAPKSSSRRSG